MRTAFALLAALYFATVGSVALGAEKVALVIGVGAYQNVPTLANPAHDADAISAVLKSLGFEVIEGVDVDKAGFDGKVRDFAEASFDSKVAMFFYAGHGMQVNGHNYLIPADAKLATFTALDFEAVDLDGVLKYTHGEGRISLAFIDACRDNPFVKDITRGFDRTSGAAGAGLAAPSVGAGGTLIAFATSPGATAAEGDGYDSPFTTALLRDIATPGLEIQQLMTRVKAEVYTATAGKQEPWHNSSLRTEFYFDGAPSGNGPVVAGPSPDEDLWGKIASTGDLSKLQLFIDSYPTSVHAGEARAKIAEKQEYVRTHVAYTGELGDSTYSNRVETFVVNVDKAIGRDLPSSGAPLKLSWAKGTTLTTEGKVSDDDDYELKWMLAKADDGSEAFVSRGDLILQKNVADRDALIVAQNNVDAMFDRIKNDASGSMGPKIAGVYGFGCDPPSSLGIGLNSLKFALTKYYWTEGSTMYQASLKNPDDVSSGKITKFKTISLDNSGPVKFFKVNWGDTKEVLGVKDERLFYSKNDANSQFGWMTLCATEATGRYQIRGWYDIMISNTAADDN